MTDFVLDEFLPYQLAVLAERTSREFSALYRERFGISIAEWRVLAHLSQSGTVGVREIHARAAMDKSKVSRAAARLQAQGLIAKKTDPRDRRLVALSLTDRGRALVDQILPLARAYEAEVEARLGPARTSALREALQALQKGGSQ
ncbi:MAG: transcriptional regulator [Paracoccaceae bacterium]|nr:MAG: transcriptional regulator [Paracoccaceae bacterium]